jgi:hypothetical protein
MSSPAPTGVTRLQRYTMLVRHALATGNWLAALVVALSLPDICGGCEEPRQSSRSRYERWFKKWIEPKYTAKYRTLPQPYVLLSAPDCYALRCALTHQGSGQTDRQKAADALTRFEFRVSPPPTYVHMNQDNGTLQLDVAVFCSDICTAVEAWEAQTAGDPGIEAEKSKLLKIHVRS